MASGPPTLCTRTALVISASPSAFPQRSTESHRRCIVNSMAVRRSRRLVNGLLAVAPGQYIEELNRRREGDGEVDIAARNMKLESVSHQGHADQHQERQGQHLRGRMLGHESRDRAG